MTEREKEVAEKYKYLFQDLCFKFEGLETKTEETFVKLVKEMGAEISNDAPLTFVQKSYFEKTDNNNRKNLYNIDYIVESVKVGTALEWDDYIFVPDQNHQLFYDDPMCYAARYIYKTDSCHKCYYDKVFCKECNEINVESPTATDQSKSPIILATDSSSESEGEITKRPDMKIIKPRSKSPKRLISSESEQDSNDETQIKSSTINSPARKKLRNSSDVDNTYCREESLEIDIENDSSHGNNNLVNRSFEEPVNESMEENFRTKHSKIKQIMAHSRKNYINDKKKNDLSDNDSSSESNIEINKKKLPQNPTKPTKSSQWIQSVKSKTFIPKTQEKLCDLPDLEPTSDVEIVPDEEDEKYFKEKMWWELHDVPEKERCSITNCTFEPGHHRSHYPARKFLSLVEKKIIVKYLIMKDAIHCAKGKVVYQNMYQDGYLKHRTWETLRNSLRRTIVKEIGSYKLSPEYVAKFKDLRVKRPSRIKQEKY